MLNAPYSRVVSSMPGSPIPDQRYHPVLDTSRANSARVWNYWLGGKDNYPIDQEVGEQIRARTPGIVDLARAGRGFLHRVVRHLAGEAGIRQFLDLGPGLPTTGHTHQIAQTIAPDCRIVYADHDPLVLAHARALLTGTPQGRTDHLHADVRDPETILREAGRTLDFTRPVALLLLEVLHFIVEDEQAHAIVDRLRDALPAGSYLLLSHLTAQIYWNPGWSRLPCGDPIPTRSAPGRGGRLLRDRTKNVPQQAEHP